MQHRALACAHTQPLSLSRALRAKCACARLLCNFESAFNEVNDAMVRLLISIRDNPKRLSRFDRCTRAALARLCLDQRIVSETQRIVTELRSRFRN